MTRTILTFWTGCWLIVAAAGCGGTGGPGPEAPPTPAAASPTFGGTLAVGAAADPKTFNPVMAGETSSGDVNLRMYDCLVELDAAALTYGPMLAERWEVSEDGRTWTFHLRQEVTWSDGTPFTAEDVAFTLTVTMDPAVNAPGRDLLTSKGEPFRVEAVDPHTVAITTAEPYGPMEDTLSTFPILPRHRLAAAYEAGKFPETLGVDTPPGEIVGTGPFQLEKYEPGIVTLRRNPHYWKRTPDGQQLPYLDRLVFLSVNDFNTWRLKFDAGEVDYYQVRPEEVFAMEEGQGQGNYTLHDLGPGWNTIHFWFNQHPGRDAQGQPYVDPGKLAWFQDLRFRQAVIQAIDRQAIVDSAHNGYGTVLHGPTSPANERWYYQKITQYPYDPDRARALLAEIGFTDRDGDGVREDAAGRPVEFTMLTNTIALLQTYGQMVASDLAKVGIKVNLTPVEFNQLVATLMSTRTYEACLLPLTGPPDPVGGLNVTLSSGPMHIFHPNQARPATAWEAEVDRLAWQCINATAFAERKRYWDQVQDLYARNLGFFYLMTANVYRAVRNTVGGARMGKIATFHNLLWNEDQLYLRR